MITIWCADHYKTGDSRFRYVLETRHWITAMMHYRELGVRQERWSLERDMYALGFLRPHYPVPTFPKQAHGSARPCQDIGKDHDRTDG